MADDKLPFLRGRIEGAQPFTSARGGGGAPPPQLQRDPVAQRAALVAQLDQLAATVESRATQSRDPEATREIIAVLPEPGHRLAAESLGDARTDVRIVGDDIDSGVVLIDAPSAELAALRQKLDHYADTTNLRPSGQPRNADLVAPVREIRHASVEDLGLDLLKALGDGAPHWVELCCRGGVYDPPSTAVSRREITRQIQRIAPDRPIAAEFNATGRVIFYAKLSLVELRELVAATDCVHEIAIAEAKIRDWLLVEYDTDDLRGHALAPPPPNAASAVLLDTGVASQHPLLAAAILSADTVVPGVTSGADIDGHGTQMAGIALYADTVGASVQSRAAQASHWIQSVKIITSASTSSDGSERATWPPMTVRAVAIAETHARATRRVFAMAVTAQMDPLVPTSWSQAIDQLAYNDGRGRVICIAAGNTDCTDVGFLAGYPQLNLVQSIQDPSQAWNALTIGAFTMRAQMPPDDQYKGYVPIAPVGGISPHSSSKPLSATRVPNKPYVVFEGGNVAFDGALPDSTVPTLTSLTTGHRPNRPLTSIWATSEATARAAHLGASIWTENPELRPETVRGLIVHSASWTDEMEQQFESLDDRLRICGFGAPDPEVAAWCVRERATVIIEDSMPNAMMVERPRKNPPKRPTTPATKAAPEQIAKFFRLPVDDDALLNHAGDVELRVTLSYLAEVQTQRRRAFRGLDLRWDMQGPQEKEEAFRWRVNKRVREGTTEKHKSKSFKWDIGPDRRESGTVQTDRWTGRAALLAGSKLIAVMPVKGWWSGYVGMQTKELPFSLIVTVRAAGLDIYNIIEIGLTPPITVPV